MDRKRIRISRTVVDLESVVSAHWGGKALYVYLDGGRFLQFRGDDAERVWLRLASTAVELPKLEAEQAA